MAIAQHNLGYLAANEAQHQPAQTHFAAAIDLYRQLGVKSSLANTLKSLAGSCLALGEEKTAVSHLREALQLTVESNIPYLMAEVLLEIALMWQQTEQSALAVTLLNVVKNAPETREQFRSQAAETLEAWLDDCDEERERVWEDRPLAEVAAMVLQKLS
jgi:tetratricopeptide (TPR) repeat protein